MPIKPQTLYTKCYVSSSFDLYIKLNSSETKLIMNLNLNLINTKDIPLTAPILKKRLPTILRSTCFNEFNNPFYEEVKATEIGHLFEHILIEYICMLKIASGYAAVEYTGLTKWNWLIYPKGTFHITVSAGIKDKKILFAAISRTIKLIDFLFTSVRSQTEKLVPLPAAYYKSSVYYQTIPQFLR